VVSIRFDQDPGAGRQGGGPLHLERALKAEQLRAERKAHDATDEGQTVACAGTSADRWDALRMRSGVRVALTGVNAAVVGLLLAALYTPVWTSGVQTLADFGLGVVAFLLLVMWRVPPWLVVILGALGATALASIA
jgi:Chromate transporter